LKIPLKERKQIPTSLFISLTKYLKFFNEIMKTEKNIQIMEDCILHLV
jgi:hypothetical protein